MSRNEEYRKILGDITIKQLEQESGYCRVSIYNWLKGGGTFVGAKLSEILERLKKEQEQE